MKAQDTEIKAWVLVCVLVGKGGERKESRLVISSKSYKTFGSLTHGSLLGGGGMFNCFSPILHAYFECMFFLRFLSTSPLQPFAPACFASSFFLLSVPTVSKVDNAACPA